MNRQEIIEAINKGFLIIPNAFESHECKDGELMVTSKYTIGTKEVSSDTYYEYKRFLNELLGGYR